MIQISLASKALKPHHAVYQYNDRKLTTSSSHMIQQNYDRLETAHKRVD
jgi:hypothetical protein